MFFTLLSPDQKLYSKDNLFNRINSLNLNVNLNKVRCDFDLRMDYEKPLFDIFVGNIYIDLNINKKGIKNLYFSFEQFQINYYENNKDNNKIDENKKPLVIFDYEIDGNKIEKKNSPQIEIKKDIGNKYAINITKINFIFNTEIIKSIIYYFKDISIFDLLLNYKENVSSKENKSLDNIDLQIIISEIQFLFPRKRSYLNLYLNQIDFNYVKALKSGINEYQIKFSLNYINSKYLDRKIIFTKNDFLLLEFDIKENKNSSFICSSLINKLNINISHYDLIFFYKIYLGIKTILKLFENEMHKPLKENVNQLDNENENLYFINYKFLNFSEINSVLGEINIEGIDITFLEENYNYIIICILNINIFIQFLKQVYLNHIQNMNLIESIKKNILILISVILQTY